MSVQEWDIECRDCHIRTDERGVQIIHQTGDTEIDYGELAETRTEKISRASVLSRGAYVWGVIALTSISTGILMLSLVEFREPFVTGYTALVAGIGTVALYKLGRVFNSKRKEEQAVKMTLETEEGERVTFTRDGGWPNGFDSYLLSRAGAD